MGGFGFLVNLETSGHTIEVFRVKLHSGKTDQVTDQVTDQLARKVEARERASYLP